MMEVQIAYSYEKHSFSIPPAPRFLELLLHTLDVLGLPFPSLAECVEFNIFQCLFGWLLKSVQLHNLFSFTISLKPKSEKQKKRNTWNVGKKKKKFPLCPNGS